MVFSLFRACSVVVKKPVFKSKLLPSKQTLRYFSAFPFRSNTNNVLIPPSFDFDSDSTDSDIDDDDESSNSIFNLNGYNNILDDNNNFTDHPLNYVRLRISNLNYEATKNDIRNHIQEIIYRSRFGGKIKDLFVPNHFSNKNKNRGHAYLTLSNVRIAETLLTDLNNSVFMNRKLKCEYASENNINNPKNIQYHDISSIPLHPYYLDASKNIFRIEVTNLPCNISKDRELMDNFLSLLGEIQSITLDNNITTVEINIFQKYFEYLKQEQTNKLNNIEETTFQDSEKDTHPSICTDPTLYDTTNVWTIVNSSSL